MITTPGTGKFTAIISTDVTDPSGKVHHAKPIRWSYDAASPYEIRLRVIDIRNGVTVEWTFSRALLSEGRFRAVGIGDVHVRPSLDRVVVDLSARTAGHSLLSMAEGDVEEFLRGTFRVLPLELGDQEELIPLIEPPVAVWAQEVQR